MHADNLPRTDPEDLLERAKRGETDAFTTLYETCYGSVYRYVFFRLKSKEEAEDLAQTVFLRAYQSLPTYEGQGKSPLAFFLTIARNGVIDFWRKKKAILDDEEGSIMARIPANNEHPLDTIARNDKLEAVMQALEDLTEEQREIITLKYMSDLSNKEIAATLGKREDAIRQLQSRALKTLRTVFTQKNDESTS